LKGHLEFIKYLIEHKADVNAKDNFGQTPLHNSAREGQFECLKSLIDNKAVVDEKDEKSSTSQIS
jgi:ankyrin repeat protein